MVARSRQRSSLSGRREASSPPNTYTVLPISVAYQAITATQLTGIPAYQTRSQAEPSWCKSLAGVCCTLKLTGFLAMQCTEKRQRRFVILLTEWPPRALGALPAELRAVQVSFTVSRSSTCSSFTPAFACATAQRTSIRKRQSACFDLQKVLFSLLWQQLHLLQRRDGPWRSLTKTGQHLGA